MNRGDKISTSSYNWILGTLNYTKQNKVLPKFCNWILYIRSGSSPDETVPLTWPSGRPPILWRLRKIREERYTVTTVSGETHTKDHHHYLGECSCGPRDQFLRRFTGKSNPRSTLMCLSHQTNKTVRLYTYVSDLDSTYDFRDKKIRRVVVHFLSRTSIEITVDYPLRYLSSITVKFSVFLFV